MPRSVRKMSAKARKERAKEAAILEREAETTYTVHFIPRPEFVKSANLNPDKWRFVVRRNPKRYAEIMESVIGRFELQHGVNSWKERATDTDVREAYIP